MNRAPWWGPLLLLLLFGQLDGLGYAVASRSAVSLSGDEALRQPSSCGLAQSGRVEGTPGASDGTVMLIFPQDRVEEVHRVVGGAVHTLQLLQDMHSLVEPADADVAHVLLWRLDVRQVRQRRREERHHAAG